MLRTLVEDRLGLTTVSGLLSVITALSLSEEGGFAGLVLCDLVGRVLAALLALAVCVSDLDTHTSTISVLRFPCTCVHQLASSPATAMNVCEPWGC
jgi:hypothetical protein